MQRVQQRRHPRQRLRRWEALALVHGLLGEEFGVGDWQLRPFEEDAAGLVMPVSKRVGRWEESVSVPLVPGDLVIGP